MCDTAETQSLAVVSVMERKAIASCNSLGTLFKVKYSSNSLRWYMALILLLSSKYGKDSSVGFKLSGAGGLTLLLTSTPLESDTLACIYSLQLHGSLWVILKVSFVILELTLSADSEEDWPGSILILSFGGNVVGLHPPVVQANNFNLTALISLSNDWNGLYSWTPISEVLYLNFGLLPRLRTLSHISLHVFDCLFHLTDLFISVFLL
jgi:hypothetical protein